MDKYDRLLPPGPIEPPPQFALQGVHRLLVAGDDRRHSPIALAGRLDPVGRLGEATDLNDLGVSVI